METNQELIKHQKESVINCDRLTLPIENRILTFRGKPIMVERDLADLYSVETKRFNEQVKRNLDRFPDSFRFQLTDDEKEELVANCDRFNSLKHSKVNPFAFTEQGVAMLSAVLKSGTAVKTSIRIIDSRPLNQLFSYKNIRFRHARSFIEIRSQRSI